MRRECCGKCKYHVKSEIPGEEGWVCNNGEAEEYGIETPHSYLCGEYESDSQAGKEVGLWEAGSWGK